MLPLNLILISHFYVFLHNNHIKHKYQYHIDKKYTELGCFLIKYIQNASKDDKNAILASVLLFQDIN